jgi:hypothetical protein
VVIHLGCQKPSCFTASVAFPSASQLYTTSQRHKSKGIILCFSDLQVTLRPGVSFIVHIPAFSRMIQVQLQKFLILISICY